MKEAEEFGAPPRGDAVLEFGAVMTRMREIRAGSLNINPSIGSRPSECTCFLERLGSLPGTL